MTIIMLGDGLRLLNQSRAKNSNRHKKQTRNLVQRLIKLFFSKQFGEIELLDFPKNKIILVCHYVQADLSTF